MYFSPSLPHLPLLSNPICGALDEISCKVSTDLYLVCPDSNKKEDHKVIAVNADNQETCIEMWTKSNILEFETLFQDCQVEVPRPGMYG